MFTQKEKRVISLLLKISSVIGVAYKKEVMLVEFSNKQKFPKWIEELL